MKPNEGNEVDKFFETLPGEDKKQADIFAETVKPTVEKTDSEPEPRKNRRHRRLEEALQAERESNIALSERIKVLSELKEERRQTEKSVDPRLDKVFGATPEGKEISKTLADILAEERAQARKEAIEEIESRESQVIEEQKHYESVIDNELEALEDKYDVDLTSDTPKANKMRREYLELVQELSPKDRETGQIRDYADFDSTFEIYQSRQEKADASRNKEIASKSMQRSGASQGQKPRITPGWNGWKKDYGFDK